jgi:hypothetical protein
LNLGLAPVTLRPNLQKCERYFVSEGYVWVYQEKNKTKADAERLTDLERRKLANFDNVLAKNKMKLFLIRQ